MKIERVIDLIVELEKHDPVAPLEVWTAQFFPQGVPDIHEATGVEQLTPLSVKQRGYVCRQVEETKALPVVLWIDRKE